MPENEERNEWGHKLHHWAENCIRSGWHKFPLVPPCVGCEHWSPSFRVVDGQPVDIVLCRQEKLEDFGCFETKDDDFEVKD